MYAIIQTGTKQYRAEPGKVIKIDNLNAQEGDQYKNKEVLLLNDGKAVQVGAPTVKGAVVSGTVIGVTKGKKIIIFKRKRRKTYRKKTGHRQQYTLVQIDSIN